MSGRIYSGQSPKMGSRQKGNSNLRDLTKRIRMKTKFEIRIEEMIKRDRDEKRQES